MKKLIILGLLAFSFGSCTRTIEQSSVPSNVLNSFNQRYPDASNVRWQEEDDNFAVRFREGKTRKEAEYRPDGRLVKVETNPTNIDEIRAWIRGDFNQPKVPDEVRSTFNNEFPDATEVVWQEVHDDYKATFMHEDTEKEAFFSASGEILEVAETTGAFEDVQDWVRGEDEGEGREEAENVPSEVKASFNRSFPNASNAEWEEEEGDFMVTFRQDNTEKEAVYRSNGTLKTVRDK
jgi:hypothetical protein